MLYFPFSFLNKKYSALTLKWTLMKKNFQRENTLKSVRVVKELRRFSPRDVIYMQIVINCTFPFAAFPNYQTEQQAPTGITFEKV